MELEANLTRWSWKQVLMAFASPAVGALVLVLARGEHYHANKPQAFQSFWHCHFERKGRRDGNANGRTAELMILTTD